MQLTQALTLVPERKREDKEEDIGSARMSMDSIIDFLTGSVRDIPVIEFDLPKILGFYNKKGKEDREVKDSMHGVRQFLRDSWDAAEEEEGLLSELIEKIVSVGVRKLGSFVARVIWGAIWRVTKWLVKEVVGFVVKNVLRYLVMPALEAVIGFLLTPAGLALAIVGGALGGAYLVYKAFFGEEPKKSMPNAASSLVGDVDDLGETATAAIPYNAPLQAGAPVSVAPSQMAPAKDLADLITKGESRSKNPYQIVNMPNANNGRGAAGTRPLETMTVAQVLAAQAAGDFNAAGRYQIINSTLKGAVSALHLNGNELFNSNLQDKIFNEYLAGPKKRPHLYAYLSGRSNDVVAAALDASQEWASVAAPAGSRLRSGAIADGYTSYYDNSRNNHASIPAAQMIATLQQERAGRSQGTSTDSSSVSMTPGTMVPAATKQNQIKNAQAAAQPGLAISPPGEEKTILRTPGGQLVAANMN
jgi:muramidase (phage lysozyme)